LCLRGEIGMHGPHHKDTKAQRKFLGRIIPTQFSEEPDAYARWGGNSSQLRMVFRGRLLCEVQKTSRSTIPSLSLGQGPGKAERR